LSGYELDDDQLALLQELATPLEKVWTDEFNRYIELFYKYLPKKPFHARHRYGDGFLCAKGTYKGRDERYDRICCPALVAKHLDFWRWQNCRPEKACPPNYWIAMLPGKKSALKTIDFDNKENLLGYYRDIAGKPRPLPTMPLEHIQEIKRLYDAFPGRTWCVSSATLGLHLWQRMPFPQSIEVIHATDRPRLREIGLGGTEIHPMFGRCFRRPFGEDYFTITDDGILEHWVKQLDYFEKVAEPPSFRAVYQALRTLLVREWDGYGATGKMEKVGLMEGKPHLLKYRKGKEAFNARQLDEDLNVLDDWADKGFPKSLAVSVPVMTDLHPVDLPGRQQVKVGRPLVHSPSDKPVSGCEIDLSEVCDGQWVQNCENWARLGLPCHDSVFQVVSQLARWFFFIEWWDMSEDMRLEKTVEILTDFVVTKHNGFVSRLHAGHERDVVKQVSRIVECAVTKVDDLGKWWFTRVRQKRQSGQYRRVIYLEPVIRLSQAGKAVGDQDEQGQEERLSGMQESNTSSPPVGFTICCSDLREGNGQNESPIEPQEDHNTSSPPVGFIICWSNLGEENAQNESPIKPQEDHNTSSPPVGFIICWSNLGEENAQNESPIKPQEDHNTSPPPVGFIICWSNLGEENARNESPIEPQEDHNPSSLPLEVNNGLSDLGDTARAPNRRLEAEQWKFQPDDTPLPDELKTTVEEAYRDAGKRLFKPTMRKITCFINYLRKKGGEARLGVKALAKMGFFDGDQRRHLAMLADAGIVRKIKGYSPALAQGLKYRLTKKTMATFRSLERNVRSA